MADNPSLVNQPQELELTKQPVKKKYETPRIIYSAPLEAMAGACSGTGKNPATCSSGQFS